MRFPAAVFSFLCILATTYALECYKCEESHVKNADGLIVETGSCGRRDWMKQECLNGSSCAFSDVKNGETRTLLGGCVSSMYCDDLKTESETQEDFNVTYCTLCSTDLCNDNSFNIASVWVFLGLVCTALFGVFLARFDLWTHWCRKRPEKGYTVIP